MQEVKEEPRIDPQGLATVFSNRCSVQPLQGNTGRTAYKKQSKRGPSGFDAIQALSKFT